MKEPISSSQRPLQAGSLQHGTITCSRSLRSLRHRLQVIRVEESWELLPADAEREFLVGRSPRPSE